MSAVSLFTATQFKSAMKFAVDNCDDEDVIVFLMAYFEIISHQLHFITVKISCNERTFFDTCVSKRFEFF